MNQYIILNENYISNEKPKNDISKSWEKIIYLDIEKQEDGTYKSKKVSMNPIQYNEYIAQQMEEKDKEIIHLKEDNNNLKQENISIKENNRTINDNIDLITGCIMDICNTLYSGSDSTQSK